MNRFLKKAIDLANHLPDDNYRLAAIITDKKGRLLSCGFNNYQKTHPTQAYYAKKVGKINKIFLHAELHALVKLSSKLKAHAIYIARTNKHGIPRLAEPCEICKQAIKESDIKEVYYT